MCKRIRTRRSSTVEQNTGDQPFRGRSARQTSVQRCIAFAKKISNRAGDRLGNIIRLMREMGLDWWASYKAARKLVRLGRGSSDPMVRARKAESAMFRISWGMESSRRGIYQVARSAISRADGVLWRLRGKLSTRFTAALDKIEDETFENLEHGHGQRAYVKYVRRGIEVVVNSGVGSIIQSIRAGGNAYVTGMCPCGSHSLSYVHCYRYWGLRCRRLADSAREFVAASDFIDHDEAWNRLLFEAREVLDHSGMLIDGLNAAAFHGVASVLLPWWAKVLYSGGKKLAYIITGERFMGPPSSRPVLGETDRLVRTCAIMALYITACEGESVAKGHCVGYLLAIAIFNGRGVEQVGAALDRLWPNLLYIASGATQGSRVCWPLV